MKLTFKDYWVHYKGVTLHKFWVLVYLMKVSWTLFKRGLAHDLSKYSENEAKDFATYTPKLKHSTYDSEEYHGYRKAMESALNHHYLHNSHHPEHFGEDGIKGMSLIDQIEMLCDWAASVRRHADGDLKVSINKNADRFEYGEFYKKTLDNTAMEAGLFRFLPSRKTVMD